MKKNMNFSTGLLILTLAFSTASVAATGNQDRVSDRTVKSSIEDEISRQHVSNSNVAVTVEDRMVVLSGTVSSLDEKRKLGEAAQKVAGVSKVDNRLSVGAASDKEVAQSVRRALVMNANLGVFDWVEARVNKGVVSLSGAVREPQRKIDFEDDVKRVAGVTSIDNKIKVLPLSTFDDDIRNRMARSIYGNSQFTRYSIQANPPIHIIVDNGRVVLKGVVANKMERQIAETIARGVPFAFEVRNELRVESQS